MEKFRRKLRLPETSKTDQVEATMEHGVRVLTVEMKLREVKTIGNL